MSTNTPAPADIESLGQQYRASPPCPKIVENFLKVLVPAMARLGARFERPGLERDDLLQEARLAALRALENWDPEKGKLWTYAYGKMLRAMQGKARQVARGPTLASLSDPAITDGLAAPPDPDFAVREAIAQALAVLPESERQILSLRAEGFNNREIAEMFGISPERVRQLYKGARGKAATLLAELESS